MLTSASPHIRFAMYSKPLMFPAVNTHREVVLYRFMLYFYVLIIGVS